MTKKVVFLTGTRADYGKLKSLMLALENSEDFELYIFVCGMHIIKALGSTYEEIIKDGYRNIYIAYGLNQSYSTSSNLGDTIRCFSGYVENIMPDMIVVHGDRMEALAGAIVGVSKNIMVAHIEGGELSGTIDESIRHAISKFAHSHFVCTDEARTRLIQLGEEEKRIHVIGSPDVDVMLSNNLPSFEEACRRYDINFKKYGILMYHPVTTEYEIIGGKIKAVVDSVIESDKNYVAVYPNNDLGSEVILNEFRRLENNPKIKIYPSIRFEHFLTLLKNADFMIGNSSAGVRETGVYGVPAIDIGTRQNNRYSLSVMKNIQHTCEDKDEILSAINNVDKFRFKVLTFGKGDSTQKFIEIISNPEFWNIEIQKHFVDYEM